MLLIFGIVLFILGCYDIIFNGKKNVAFAITSFLMTLLLAIRFGQGTDYFGYYFNYNLIGTLKDEIIIASSHGEILWRIIQSIFKLFNLRFEVFVIFIAIVSMCTTIRAIKENSPYKLLSLFLLFPTFYLTYYYSAMRQGIAMALFLSFGINFLKDKEYIKYFILVILLSLIHTSAVMLVVLPLVISEKVNSKIRIIFISLIFLPLLFFFNISNIISSNISMGLSYSGISVSILGILVRIIMFIIITIMYNKYKNKAKDVNNNIELFYKIYKFGFIISILLSFNSLISQRMTAYYKILEVLLIPMLLEYSDKKRKKISLIPVMIFMIFFVEMYKNIDSYLNQGSYYNYVNVYNMPIVTIFNESDIYKYRNTIYKVDD